MTIHDKTSYQKINPKPNENFVTEMFADLLRMHPSAIRGFLGFLGVQASNPNKFKVSIQVSLKARLPREKWSGSPGKINLVLENQADNLIIGSEHKIDDDEKPGRMLNYKNNLLAFGYKRTYLVQITARPPSPYTGKKFIDRKCTWSELTAYFDAILLKNRLIRSHWSKFRVLLVASGAIDASGGAQPIRVLRAASKSHWIAGLNDLKKKLPKDLDQDCFQERGMGPRIQIGIPSWKTKFNGEWRKRIWVISKPLPHSPAYPWCFHVSILLHNASFTNFSIEVARFPIWAPILNKTGWIIWRAPDNKGWSGGKRLEVRAPWKIPYGIQWFIAQRPEGEIEAHTAKLKGKKEAVLDDALERINRAFRLVDKFPK